MVATASVCGRSPDAEAESQRGHCQEQQSSGRFSLAKPAPSSGEPTQHPSPRHASIPSRTATPGISSPTAGSSHQAPTSALPRRPTSGKTAVYVARSSQARARGPFPAPADSLITKPAYRSRTAASETDPIASVYAAQVPLKRPGRYSILVVTKIGTDLLGAATEVQVRGDTPIPAVGDRPPAAKTHTIASANGDLESIDTRVPARRLHEQSFDEVLGKRPVALLFATPQLCQSRVCGPVVDVAAQLQAQYGDCMTFIHQEVYIDNQVDKGLRPPLRSFHLLTEPWLFTIATDGRVARLEGSFGVRAFEQAVQAALQ